MSLAFASKVWRTGAEIRHVEAGPGCCALGRLTLYPPASQPTPIQGTGELRMEKNHLTVSLKTEQMKARLHVPTSVL